MKTARSLMILTLLAGSALVACQEEGPLEPSLDTLSVEDQLTLEILADPVSMEAALELASVQESAAHRRGWRWQNGGNYVTQAEHCFRTAQEAFAQGNQVRAMKQAREGRRLVALAVESAGGPTAVQGMIERLESLPLEVSADPDAFLNSQKLGLQLGQLATQARTAYRKGQSAEAGGLGVLAEQAFRHNRRHQNQVGAGRAEVMVALGGEAVELATELVGAQSATDTEQADLLETAKQFQASAEAALEAGEDRRAAHLAHLAQWWSLKAVVLPGGITDEEARAMLDLAETLLAEATTALGPEPTELQAALLTRATRLLERGKEGAGNGTCRGLGALWQSAVISSYLLG